MKKLKEYAGVIVALVTVMTALASLSLWAIHVQINPEIRRLDGRIESFTARVDRMDERWEARVDRMDAGWEAGSTASKRGPAASKAISRPSCCGFRSGKSQDDHPAR